MVLSSLLLSRIALSVLVFVGITPYMVFGGIVFGGWYTIYLVFGVMVFGDIHGVC